MSTDDRATSIQASEYPMVSPSGGVTDDGSLSETRRLIAASKVNGTHVYNREGASLGSVYDVMINKRSGMAEYAILSFGGFLGMGKDYHPLPWHVLRYDERMGGYVVDLDLDRLQSGPAYATGDVPDWSTGDYASRIDDHYGTAPPPIAI